MVNRVILIGNLGKDPEVRRLENGAVVAKFTLATNENYKDKSGEWQTLTEWHDIVVWRQLAERAEATLKKGMPVYVEGKLTHRTWQDQDGNNRRTTEIVANYFRALGSKKEGGGDFQTTEDEYATTTSSSFSAAAPPPMDDNAGDDLPF
jgi:single-strand DNA-binding protein